VIDGKGLCDKRERMVELKLLVTQLPVVYGGSLYGKGINKDLGETGQYGILRRRSCRGLRAEASPAISGNFNPLSQKPFSIVFLQDYRNKQDGSYELQCMLVV
jgi:hypothetical protein